MKKHQVSLVSWTQDALEVLLFTRNTRLQMSPGGLREVKEWPEARKFEELKHALNTIQSSFEFIDYIFTIEGVTRAFTHQLVRHRIGTSFAQQAQRVVDMSDFDYYTGPSIREQFDRMLTYRHHMSKTNHNYHTLLEQGADTQDARGVLPTNILTNIVFKANLRTLHDMALRRLCVKAQGEFQEVFRDMRDAVIEVHPYFEPFIRVQCGSTGTCAFPDFPVKECPVKAHVYNPVTCRSYGDDNLEPLWTKNDIQYYWDDNRNKVVQTQPTINRADRKE